MHERLISRQITVMFATGLSERTGMKTLIATFILMAFLGSDAYAGKTARGATPPRKTRHVKVLEVDIEDLVRAEDDPNFQEYLKERAANERVDESAIEKQKAERLAYEESLEKGRLEFIKERDSTVKPNYMGDYNDYKSYRQEQQKWRMEREKERKQQVAEREVEIRKIQVAKQERLLKAFPNQRLPASIEEPKYPKHHDKSESQRHKK